MVGAAASPVRPGAACLLLLAACTEGSRAEPPLACKPPRHALAVTGFHGDERRLGWNDRETELAPERLREGQLTLRWRSDAFGTAELQGRKYAAHVYASPLYVDDVDGLPRAGGRRVSLVIAATSNAEVYAIHAPRPACAGAGPRAGATLWRARLGTPAALDDLDQGMPMGVLSTPVIDLERTPQRVYAVAFDAAAGWRAFALELATGRVLDDWPVAIDDAALAAVNSNGPARFQDPHARGTQRQLRSSKSAMPWPTPMHMVHRARRLLLRSSS
jgi:hypothetical protein